VKVLEQHAERRLTMAQTYAEKGDGERVQNLLQSYLQIKEKQGDLLGKNDDGEVLGIVEDRTIEQQKVMEEIKNIIIDDMGKQGVIDVQEQVVNQVAKNIVEVNGTQGQTEFFNKVEHVWAPGTGPGGEAGVVIVGGAMQFAPGTSAGGPSGSDIKTNVVVGGGGTSGGGTTVVGGGTNVIEGGGGSGGGSTNTVVDGDQNADPGTSSDGSKTWIDP